MRLCGEEVPPFSLTSILHSSLHILASTPKLADRTYRSHNDWKTLNLVLWQLFNRRVLQLWRNLPPVCRKAQRNPPVGATYHGDHGRCGGPSRRSRLFPGKIHLAHIRADDQKAIRLGGLPRRNKVRLVFASPLTNSLSDNHVLTSFIVT